MVVTNTTFVLEKFFINVFPLKNFFIYSLHFYKERRSPCRTKQSVLITFSRLDAKAVLIDHISSGRLQLIYTAKQQIHNSGFWWSILTGQLWSSPLVFPIIQQLKQDFAEIADSAISILQDAITKTDYLKTDRVIRCIIFFDNAIFDLRDVMLWAEYEKLDEKFKHKRVRDFNKTFDKCTEDVKE